MNMDDNVKPCELLDLIEEKLTVFKSFLSATALLKDATDLQEMKKIELLIVKRENCINVIDWIDSRINRIKNSILALPGDVMEKIRLLTKAIDDTATEATHLNKEFETMLIRHRDDTKKQLSKVSQNRNGVKSYAVMARGGNQPVFLNITS